MDVVLLRRGIAWHGGGVRKHRRPDEPLDAPGSSMSNMTWLGAVSLQ